MFKWLSVINKLSKEAGYIDKQDKKIAALREQIVALQKQQADCKELLDSYVELYKSIQTSSSLLNEVESKITACAELAETKLTEIKDEAEKYTSVLAEQINSYENNFSKINQKIAELKDAVTSLQR